MPSPESGGVLNMWYSYEYASVHFTTVSSETDYPNNSRHASRNPDDVELWIYGQEPYAPSFVVKIDFLSGEESQFVALDEKMQIQYFRHRVQLGWLIDPRPGWRKMFEYKLDEDGKVYRVDDDEWRDLDGGDVLPGFHLNKTDLEMVLDPIGDVSPDEDEIDIICPCRGCDERLKSLATCVGHLESHRAERERRKYLAKRAARKPH